MYRHLVFVLILINPFLINSNYAQEAIEKVDFEIYEGDITSVIGLSGTGKRLILNLIAGLRKPDEGQVLYRGKAIDQMNKKEWNDYIGKISCIFQNNALFNSKTVYENVAMPLKSFHSFLYI